MPLPPTTGHNFASEFGSTVRRAVDDISRQQSYATAAQVAAIGLEFDEIKVLVDRLLQDLESVPKPASVGEVTGASSYVADVFARPLKNATLEAYRMTNAIKFAVSNAAEAVRLTIEDISASDTAAHDTLEGQASRLEDVAADTSGFLPPHIQPPLTIAQPASDTGAAGNSWDR